MSEYRVLLFRCQSCDRPIPVINSGMSHTPEETMEIACFEGLVCQWKGRVHLILAEQTLTVYWNDKKSSSIHT